MIAAGFEAVAEAFAAAQAGDPGDAQLAVYRDGRLVVDLRTGPHSIGMVMSCTKGVVATAAHLLAQRGLLAFDAPVARYWPEFAANGKRGVTVAHLLSHSAGLAGYVPADPFDWERCVNVLAAMAPRWQPGSAYAYHSLSYGYLVGEVIRRITGVTVGEFVRAEFAAPLGLDLWIGLPESEEHRVAPVLDDGFPLSRLLNTRAGRAAEVPAANGVADAPSLARLYAALIGEVDGLRVLSAEVVERARTPRTDGLALFGGFDEHAPRFGLGYELPRPGNPMLGPGCFGHAGSGGRLAFADPARGLAVGYTCTAMRWRPEHGADARWLPWLAALGLALTQPR